MTDLLLTILCSTSIALILKQNDTRQGHPVLLLAGNYFIAAVIGGIYILLAVDPVFSLQTFIFGMMLAVLFVLAFFAFAKSVSVAGTAMAAVSSRLSVIVPILLSVLFFKETPSHWQLLGFLFALITILLFYRSLKGNDKKPGHLRDYLYLLGVLLGIGINDFFMKVFQHWRGEQEKPFFLFMIFFFAFLYTFGYVHLKKISIDRNTALLGGVLGIPNIFSSYFLLSALAVLPGIIVYPVTNIGIIVLTTFAAALLWKERLNRQGKWAMITGILAILLLTL